MSHIFQSSREGMSLFSLTYQDALQVQVRLESCNFSMKVLRESSTSPVTTINGKNSGSETMACKAS